LQIIHNDHNNFNAACKVSNQTTPSKISCHLYDLFIGLQKKKKKKYIYVTYWNAKHKINK